LFFFQNRGAFAIRPSALRQAFAPAASVAAKPIRRRSKSRARARSDERDAIVKGTGNHRRLPNARGARDDDF